LNLDGVKYSFNCCLLNTVLKQCVNLEVLSMKDCLLNKEKISKINFFSISPQLKEVDLSKNRDIDDFSFLIKLLTKAKHVSKLILADMSLNKNMLNNIKIGNLCKYLEIIDLSNNCLYDCHDFLNDLFVGPINMTTLVLKNC